MFLTIQASSAEIIIIFYTLGCKDPEG